jgi:hypothetical protein
MIQPSENHHRPAPRARAEKPWSGPSEPHPARVADIVGSRSHPCICRTTTSAPPYPSSPQREAQIGPGLGLDRALQLPPLEQPHRCARGLATMTCASKRHRQAPPCTAREMPVPTQRQATRGASRSPLPPSSTARHRRRHRRWQLQRSGEAKWRRLFARV